MHLHILGIAGTFMGGLAQIAQAAGHRVTGADTQVYPPMSTQLEQAGIEFIEGFDPAQLDMEPDVVVVGNIMTRGQPLTEALLNSGLRYTSGPQWLAEHILADRWVLAVSGTHGKTTTSSMLAWILEYAGLNPGFLIGGVPENFGHSARLNDSPFFVIEADEYDTAFFDKRSKFVHYRPRTLVVNNIEYDHADIFPDLASIQRQFHHLIRTVPSEGVVISPSGDQAAEAMLEMGCWTPVTRFGNTENNADWQYRPLVEDCSHFEVLLGQGVTGRVRWKLSGHHNARNGLAAIAAARHAGVPVEHAAAALSEFQGVARRMQLLGEVEGIRIYDDFAHHPTAIATTIDGQRHRLRGGRLVVVFEPRSNTMRMGIHEKALANAFAGADQVFVYAAPGLGWDVSGLDYSVPAESFGDIGALRARILAFIEPGDDVIVMSNGSFGGLHQSLLNDLKLRPT
ncbi:MAG: UDP-N-acetylmuramate:L-alanyl-gamma-D-glutamyl-meso-diaminopimelate ligase [Thiotrichales bacterium]